MEAQEYGNTLADVRRFLKPGLFFFSCSFISLGVAEYLGPRTLSFHVWMQLFEGAAFIGAVIPFIVLITALFGIRIHDGFIDHTFARRFVISRHRLSDIERVVLWSQGHPLVVHFKDGSRLRFIGARMNKLMELANYLKSQS